MKAMPEKGDSTFKERMITHGMWGVLAIVLATAGEKAVIVACDKVFVAEKAEEARLDGYSAFGKYIEHQMERDEALKRAFADLTACCRMPREMSAAWGMPLPAEAPPGAPVAPEDVDLDALAEANGWTP